LSEITKPFLVRRTCTLKTEKAGEQDECRPLEEYRDLPAYVLLGDPGAGKTSSFEKEAGESGGKCVKARDFATFEPGAEYQGKTLFIDGLDEMRADGGDGRTPLDHIRNHLDRLERPRFRISCREADWLGASDSEALKRVSPDGEIVALHLDPLSNSDIAEILRHKPEIADAEDFMRQATEHGLEGLLRNPQTLNLLVDAVGGDAWPQSRTQVYEMACSKLVSEPNPEHRQAKREKALPAKALLDASGYLCAIQLLSGVAGFALDEAREDKEHPCWKGLAKQGLPLLSALKTNIFQKDGEERRNPAHRSIAEFLGARYLSSRIESDGLPFGRVLALLTGEDGGVVSDLRGLAAWLSVHCLNGRRTLIEHDPLGVVLYGDVRDFPVADKQIVLAALGNEARRYPWFRSGDWASSPFGALATADMKFAFLEIFTSPSREEAYQALMDCVLDAIRHGERMQSLAAPLETMVRDASYWPVIRKNALRALIHVLPDTQPGLLKLAEDVCANTVEDSEDELLGVLLGELYPHAILPSRIFDYLHRPKADSLIGSYSTFWSYKLPDAASRDDLPLLLDNLAKMRPTIRGILKEYQLNRLAGKLLVRGLEDHGDTIPDERLFTWLGVGLDEYEHPRLDREYTEHISAWFAARPARYKAVIEYGFSQCATHENPWYCMNRCVMRLYGAPKSADIGMWYLEKAAAEQHAELAQFYFAQSVHMLKRQGGQEELAFVALEFLESWVAAYPKFHAWLEPFISCSIGDCEQEHALEDRERKIEQQKRKSEWVGYYRQHIAAIREGSAYPRIFYELAEAHEGLQYEARGDTPRQRLEDFLDGDTELVEAAYSGFLHVLDRADLPNVSEIVALELKGEMHHIHWACLIGMDQFFQNDPVGAMQLPEGVLSSLLAFRLSYQTGDDPAWFTALMRIRPALVAEVLLAYALPMLRAGKEHVSGLSQLVRDEAYAEVARIALPKLLEGFPLRAKTNQLTFMLDSLLKGALHYLDRDAFAALVARKLGLTSMDAAQRVYWLSCGLLLAPDVYETPLFQYIGKSEVRRGYLANFIYNDYGRRGLPDWVSIPTSTLGRLVELLGPGCSNQRRNGVVTAAMRMADMVRSYINTLGNNPDEAASRELERLLALHKLEHWRDELRGALHSQRIARRKATFRKLSATDVDRTLANLQPASASDLIALTLDHLRDIAKNIRDGSTNDYRQYWGYAEGDKKKDEPKSESDCRDALLSDLKVRLGPLGIDAQRETNYADNKRADIRVSFGGTNGFNVPIEIKKDRSHDLWRAIHEQLIPRYARDPGADGYGIYLVFWFGGKGMKPPPDGKKLRSATELETRLRQTLTPEESHRIHVCVIDCALPS